MSLFSPFFNKQKKRASVHPPLGRPQNLRSLVAILDGDIIPEALSSRWLDRQMREADTAAHPLELVTSMSDSYSIATVELTLEEFCNVPTLHVTGQLSSDSLGSLTELLKSANGKEVATHHAFNLSILSALNPLDTDKLNRDVALLKKLITHLYSIGGECPLYLYDCEHQRIKGQSWDFIGVSSAKVPSPSSAAWHRPLELVGVHKASPLREKVLSK